MALGNLEEAVQLIVDEKVEIGPAGASVKVLYSELGGSGPKSRGAEFRDTRVSQLSAAGSFDHRNFLHNELQDCPEQHPLSLPYLSRGCARSRASIPAELWLAPPSQRARVLHQLLGSPGWWGGSCTSHLLCYSCTCLPPGTGTAPESTQPRGTKTGHPTEVSTQHQRSPYSAPSKGEGGSLEKVRMPIWSIKHLVCTMLSKDAVNTSKQKCNHQVGTNKFGFLLQLWHRNRFPAPAQSQPWLCVRFQPPTGTG